MPTTPVCVGISAPLNVTASPICQPAQVWLVPSPIHGLDQVRHDRAVSSMKKFLRSERGIAFRKSVNTSIRGRQLAGALTWFLCTNKQGIAHCKAITSAVKQSRLLKRRAATRKRRQNQERVEKLRRQLQINSGSFNTRAMQKRRKLTTEEKSLQLDYDHFLNNPSQRTLQDERILKREQINDFYSMIEVPLQPQTLPFVIYRV